MRDKVPKFLWAPFNWPQPIVHCKLCKCIQALCSAAATSMIVSGFPNLTPAVLLGQMVQNIGPPQYAEDHDGLHHHWSQDQFVEVGQ